MRYVDALILAGGKGERLRSVIGDTPKPLALVNGRPFITYLLDKLQNECGFRRVIIGVGHQAETVIKTLGKKYGKTRLIYSQEDTPLGTGGAILKATEMMKHDRMLVLNGDSWCEADLSQFRSSYIRWGHRVSLVATEVPDVSRYGALSIFGNQVMEMKEKGPSGPGWISAGIYLFSKKTFLERVKTGPVSLERDVFPVLVKDCLLNAWKSQSRFIDIGTPESYALAQEVLK